MGCRALGFRLLGIMMMRDRAARSRAGKRMALTDIMARDTAGDGAADATPGQSRTCGDRGRAEGQDHDEGTQWAILFFRTDGDLYPRTRWHRRADRKMEES